MEKEKAIFFSNIEDLPKEQPHCTHNELRILPAGFDLSTLNNYNDQNHWHIKKPIKSSDNRSKSFKKCDYDEVEFVTKTKVSSVAGAGRGRLIKNMVNKFTTSNVEIVEPKLSLAGKGRVKMSKSMTPNMDKTPQLANIEIESRRSLLTKEKVPSKSRILPNNLNNTNVLSVQKLMYEREHFSVISSKTSRDIENNCSFIKYFVVVHSEGVLLKPCNSITEARLATPIVKIMKSLEFCQVYRIQSFAWPHIFRGNSLLVVNSAKSGKTWSYLPVICNLVLLCISKRHCKRSEISKPHYGPKIIVLVATQVHGIYVETVCRKLFQMNKFQNVDLIVSYFDCKTYANVCLRLMSRPCGILITTPELFLELVKKHKEFDCLFDWKEIRQVVIDDLDVMVSQSPNMCKTVLQQLFQMCRKKDKFGVQLVVTTCNWSDGLLSGLLSTMYNPLILIGDPLEAAVYGKIRFSIKICSFEDKYVHVLNYLAQQNLFGKRVAIVCQRDEELQELSSVLHTNQFSTIDYSNSANGELRDLLELWVNNLSQSLLLCTDDVLPELNIANIHVLIHFSLPNSWTKFKMRYSLISAVVPNIFGFSNDAYDNNVTDQTKLQSFIIVDTKDILYLPRFGEFLMRHKETIPEEVLNIIRELRTRRENESAKACTPLCVNLLEFENCYNEQCKQRHIIKNSDFVTKNSAFPTDGDVRVEIFKIFSPSHMAARLLMYKGKREIDNWVPMTAEFIRLSTNLHLHYSNPNNCLLHWPPVINDICIIKTKSGYERVRVVQVPTIENETVVQVLTVTVRPLDNDTELIKLNSNALLLCNDKFKKVPAFSVDIYIRGLMPKCDGRIWNMNATKLTKDSLMKKLPKNVFIQATIDFSLKETIFVQNIIIVEYLPSISIYANKFNLKIMLKTNGYSKNIDMKTETMLESLVKKWKLKKPIDICTKKNLNEEHVKEPLQNYNEVRKKLPDISNKTVAINWSTLALGMPTRVEIMSNILNGQRRNVFIRFIDKIRFEELNKMIFKHVNQQKLMTQNNRVDQINFDLDYIIKYKDGYCRARISDINRGIHHAYYNFFLVDYGIFLGVLSHKLFDDFLYESSNTIIKFMPFQAVHCTLAGIEINSFTYDTYIFDSNHVYVCALVKNFTHAKSNTLGYNSYDVVFYDCEYEDRLSNANIVNEQLVLQKMATYSKPNNFLQNLNFNDLVEKSNFCDLLDCVESCSKLDAIKNKEKEYKTINLNTTIHVNTEGIVQQLSNNSTIVRAKDEPSRREQDTCKYDILKQFHHTQIDRKLIRLLKTHIKLPAVKWYDTETNVFLNISSIDVVEYTILCQDNELFYSVKETKEDVLLNFYAPIFPNLLIHTQRGLSVFVKLTKRLWRKWPHLIKTNVTRGDIKMPWLKYDLSQNLSETTELCLMNSLIKIADVDLPKYQQEEDTDDSDLNNEYNDDYDNHDLDYMI